MAAMSNRLSRALAFDPFEPLDGHGFADRAWRAAARRLILRVLTVSITRLRVLRIRLCHLLLASAQPAG